MEGELLLLSVLQEAVGVLRGALEAHLEVQVRAGGTTGGTDLGDLLAALDQGTLLDQHFGGVGVTGDQLVAVIDLDQVAVLGMALGGDHDAGGGGDDRGAGVGDEIDAFVKGLLAGEGIDAPAEAGGVPLRLDRQGGRQLVLLHPLVHQFGLDQAKVVALRFELAGELVELALQVFRGQRTGRGDQRAALAGLVDRLGLRLLDAGELPQALAEGIEAHQLGLQLAQAHRHGVEVLAQELLRLLSLLLAHAHQQALQEGQAHLRGVAHGEVGKQRGYGQHGQHEAGHRQRQVAGGDRNGPGGCQSVGDENNMHAVPPYPIPIKWQRVLSTLT
jgi:hypothetical protein